MARILITGASGFIGSHLLPKLQTDGHEITGVDSTAGNVESDATWALFAPAEVVIHLAGRSFVPESWQHPAEFLNCNLGGAIRALDYCRTHSARLVFLSSYLYGHPRELPIPETAPLIATNPYSLSKKLAEEVCEFYAERFGVGVTILRPFNVYGPGQKEPFLIPSIIGQVRRGGPVRVHDLAPRRDYIYIADLVDSIASSVNLRYSFNVINVGSGVSHSVVDVIQIIQDLTGMQLEVEASGERRPSEIMDTVADISKAREVLGWIPKWTISEGIKATLAGE